MTIESFTPAEERERAVRSRRMLTWLLVFAIVMFFAGLTSAYIVSMSGGYWTRIRMPEPFYWSTAFVLAGSLTVHLALISARTGRMRLVAPLILATLGLGLAFGASQFKGWGRLVAIGITPSPNKLMGIGGTYGVDFTVTKDGQPLVPHDGHWYASSDSARGRQLDAEVAEQRDRTGPYFYALTAAHAAHVVFGLLSLVVMLVMALRGRYSPENHVGLWAGAVFWHFLGGLWVFLFFFLRYVH
ncbi:MAG: heme-copper oxidase subunit III [Flavobacteriales bacterium]|nr:heme-copper oxidase subunit III [Flavobacteriales bacterium]